MYIATAFAISLGGLYLVWVRGSTVGPSIAIGISLNGALIMVFAALALRYARSHAIHLHRRWALRTFIVVNGVWFFRVGMMFWIFVNQGPVGIGTNFDGPFIVFWSFGTYLLPLAVLEMYFRTQDRGGTRSRITMATALAVLTVGMGIGIAMVSGFMWLPNL